MTCDVPLVDSVRTFDGPMQSSGCIPRYMQTERFKTFSHGPMCSDDGHASQVRPCVMFVRCFTSIYCMYCSQASPCPCLCPDRRRQHHDVHLSAHALAAVCRELTAGCGSWSNQRSWNPDGVPSLCQPPALVLAYPETQSRQLTNSAGS